MTRAWRAVMVPSFLKPCLSQTVAGWRERMKALPGWGHPYDLMPGHPLPAKIAQFLDRGLGLLIPLRVAHMPGVEAIAATSGLIISVRISLARWPSSPERTRSDASSATGRRWKSRSSRKLLGRH